MRPTVSTVRHLPVLVALLTTSCAVPSACAPPPPDTYSFAFIGDTPYGSKAMAAFPQLVSLVNTDPDIELVAHVGDIRGRDSDCSDATLRTTYDLFQQFDAAFWLTPGDNDWFDCHRAGGHLPTERLAFLRSLFYADPASTTGRRPIAVTSQASSPDPAMRPFVENTVFQQQCVTFGAVHVIGYGDGIEAWDGYVGDPAAGRAKGDQRDVRLAGNAARRAAALAWIDSIFDSALQHGSSGVFLMMQAEPVDDANYLSLRTKVLERARAFPGQVLLGHGDSHQYRDTDDYAGVPNLHRLEVAGDEAAIDEWVKVTADCDTPEIFSWERREFRLAG